MVKILCAILLKLSGLRSVYFFLRLLMHQSKNDERIDFEHKIWIFINEQIDLSAPNKSGTYSESAETN